jgi:type I restriction enzyme R subunit
MAKAEFDKELDFEHALIRKLFEGKGWEHEVLKYSTEEDLMKNWADILYQNNRQKDRLGNYPLTKGEMRQLINQINDLRTPFNLNGFINGKTTSIKRDNPDDKLHMGKEVTLKLYDRTEIAGGQSRYQIAEQPVFNTHHPLKSDRRGDFMLLINGMPVIHVELKKSDDALFKATNQIEKYTHEGVFRRGIFSLVQVFVAMTPGRMVYFANPGYDGVFNDKFFFHWANPDNVEYKGWRNIAEQFFYIPFVHQLIGFYTVADKTDSTLKVMRSYQYWAARQISLRVAKIEEKKWMDIDYRGGFIAHATGSGKTMTSFKSALLIADSKDADKVVFLVDRIELDTQSAGQYKNFSADKDPEVQDTADTNDLIAKLKNDDDVLIVTSIQKMSRIKGNNNNQRDLELINRKRIVVILDECHRSTFGDMLKDIKASLKHAVYFGFTGTPITEENKKKQLTTTDLFGDELHRYSLADAINDGNVLGFDPYMVPTYAESQLREVVALDQAHAFSEEEALNDPSKKKVYLHFMNEVPMAGKITDTEVYLKGIEDYIPDSQYNSDKHRKAVVEDIKNNWVRLSMNSKYHALLATSSIPEAVGYYKLIKAEMPDLKVTCLFDPTDDNTSGGEWKEDAIVDMLQDYAEMFSMEPFKVSQYSKFKKDVSARLAHKEPYNDIEPKEQLNLLIVVNQMLTGYDSKWLNTLYLDKMLQYEHLIQACSRTNRLADWDKQNGIIRYYRRVFTMKRNQDDAIKLYAGGDKALSVFVNKLPENIRLINSHFATIFHIFAVAKIKNFSQLPEENSERRLFAKEFHALSMHLQAALMQDFKWKNPTWIKGVAHQVDLDERTYNILLERYKELFHSTGGGGGEGDDEPPYNLDTHLMELSSEKVNADYMNSRFVKYVRSLQGNNPSEEVQASLDDLHSSFAYLTKDEQKMAEIILGDFQNGTLKLDGKKTLRDYIIKYSKLAKDDEIHRFALAIGIDENKLRELFLLVSSGENINDFGRLDKLEETLKIERAQEFIGLIEHKRVSKREARRESDRIISKFITDREFDASTKLEVWPKLQHIEDNSRVRNFIDMNLLSEEGITLEKLWATVQHEFGGQYAGTSAREWYNLLRDYVKEKTHKSYISNKDIIKLDMAAEP